MIRKALALLVLAATACSPTMVRADAPSATTILIVRHAEAASDGSADPALSDAGVARAETLAAVARDANIRAVYTTQYRRTRDTAAALAKSDDIPIIAVPVEREEIERQSAELAEIIVEKHPGETVVVIGHSNTVPEIVEALSGAKIEPIAHAEYDRLYVVIREPGAPARVIAARYGVR